MGEKTTEERLAELEEAFSKLQGRVDELEDRVNYQWNTSGCTQY